MKMTGPELGSLAVALLKEDVGRGDLTTQSVVAPDAEGRARIEAREAAVVAGLDVARAVFDAAADEPIGWQPKSSDGAEVAAEDVLVVVEGSLASILTAERTALNLLAHLSGVATATRRFVSAIDGCRAKITDTRKTTPGLRALEKYAVSVGGGTNHRFGLDDGILIKDNHIAAAGGVGSAIAKAQRAPHTLRLEIEVQDLAELEEAIAGGADVVLLDNMEPEDVAAAVRLASGRVILEASGGITLENVRAYADSGVDLISVGAITHSSQSIDLSLEVEG